MKKSMSVVLGLLLASTLVFTACGKDNSSEGSSPASSGATPSGNDASGEEVTLVIAAGNDNIGDFADQLKTLVHEKFPNITVEFQSLPTDQYITSVRAKLASGGGPDIFAWWPKMTMKPLVDAGYLKDLTSEPILTKFNESVVDTFKFDGKAYAVPQTVDALGVYYNKDLFAKAGITEFPNDWPSFLAASDKLLQAGITPLAMGDKDSWVPQFPMYQITPSVVYADDMKFDDKLYTGETKFTDPKWIQAIEKYKTLYDKGYVMKGSLGMAVAQAQQLFNDGKVAMTITGTWDYTTLMKKGQVEFERGFMPLPSNEPGKPLLLSTAASVGYAVNANTKHYDQVMQVLNYWFDGSSPLFQAWNASQGGMPAYKGVEYKMAEFQDFYKLFQSNQSVYFNNQAWPNGVGEEMSSQLQNLISGNATAQDVTKAMQAKFDELKNQAGK
jgi:raffinose/stachyose/melibiose transport system substrate-binding protein